MTDFFALLDQPRRPWLDPEKLKEAFHAKTLRTHPDANARGADAIAAESAFAQINEAHQVLRDPKRRLQHLLSLEGRPPAAGGGTVPREIADAFQAVAASTQTADVALQKTAAATSPLSRSLVAVELSQARSGIDEALGTLLALRQEADAELRDLSDAAAAADDRFSRLENLYFRYAYLTRWIGQLEEKRTQLATW